jgi:hypothetical protein
MERYRVYSGTAPAWQMPHSGLTVKTPLTKKRNSESSAGRESVGTSVLRLVSIARVMPPNPVTTAEENRLKVHGAVKLSHRVGELVRSALSYDQLMIDDLQAIRVRRSSAQALKCCTRLSRLFPFLRRSLDVICISDAATTT